jgi:hypothetical protein
MAFGTNPVGTYPSYVIAGPVPNAFPPQMNPYLAVNPQQAIANPASKSPPTSSAPSQPFINQYAQPTQGMGIPSGVAQYAAQMGQNGQPPVNWAEFIPSSQVSSMNGNHSHKSEGKSGHHSSYFVNNKKFPQLLLSGSTETYLRLFRYSQVTSTKEYQRSCK